MPRKKKTNRRNSVKYPALKKQYNLLTRKDLIDFPYLDQLNDKEKEWLNKFVEEEINADFRGPGKPLNKTKKSRQRIYNANNARNRCILTRSKASGELDELTADLQLHELNPMEMMELVEETELKIKKRKESSGKKKAKF